ncbi:tubby C-terminal-like domain-containing protein [Scenedesmus sp. NREL 46B-D3]|nr:tubby C-terminal-like domain-containing protein [Scenedesmus sp. NREL 46B-D3]
MHQELVPTTLKPLSLVVSPQFCMPQQTVLVMQEQAGYKSDDFTITDATGRPFFKLSAALFSIGNKRQLLDAYGSPLLHMERKMLSLHGTWLLLRPSDGAKLAELKSSLMSLTPSIKVYLNDGDKEPDFVVKGDFRSKRFSIFQRTRGSDVAIAQVQRESRFSSSSAFLMSMMTDAQKYFVTIEPGVDAAFVVGLATLCDEIFNDKE